MSVISVLENIDTINYIIQHCVQLSTGKELVPRNSFVHGEGYAMDVRSAGTRSHLNLHVRTDYLQDLCRIMLTPKKMVVRYSAAFMFVYNPKTALFTTNLFDEPFTLDDLEAVFFTQNCVQGWGLQVEFDYDTMVKTLTMCRGIYDAFLEDAKKP
ncbi:hypothetical protein ENKO_075 [Klebsiella phage fENko-Kae01]|nr:hypothetical protein [Klebsiella phage fENko-Kae01]